MPSDKQQNETPVENAAELEIEQLDEVVGGRKQVGVKPIIGDPCAGGE